MRRTTALLAAAALALATIGCSSEPDRPKHEQQYLDALYDAARKNGSGIKGFGDDKNLELGYAVCKDLAAGKTPGDIAAGLKASDNGPVAKVAAAVVGNAELYLCDEAAKS